MRFSPPSVSRTFGPTVKLKWSRHVAFDDEGAGPTGRDPPRGELGDSLEDRPALYPTRSHGLGQIRRKIHEGRTGSPDGDLPRLPERADEEEFAHEEVVGDGADAHMDRSSGSTHHRARSIRRARAEGRDPFFGRQVGGLSTEVASSFDDEEAHSHGARAVLTECGTAFPRSTWEFALEEGGSWEASRESKEGLVPLA